MRRADSNPASNPCGVACCGVLQSWIALFNASRDRSGSVAVGGGASIGVICEPRTGLTVDSAAVAVLAVPVTGLMVDSAAVDALPRNVGLGSKRCVDRNNAWAIGVLLFKLAIDTEYFKKNKNQYLSPIQSLKVIVQNYDAASA